PGTARAAPGSRGRTRGRQQDRGDQDRAGLAEGRSEDRQGTRRILRGDAPGPARAIREPRPLVDAKLDLLAACGAVAGLGRMELFCQGLNSLRRAGGEVFYVVT